MGRAQAPSLHEMSAATGRRYTRVSACVDVLHTAIHGAKRGITAPVCTCQVPLAACHPCTSLVPEPQHPLVEGERFLDVAVPVLPGVRAGALGVFVGDAELLQVAMERAVFLQETILSPAVEPERGGACGRSLRPAHTDRRDAARRGAEHAATPSATSGRSIRRRTSSAAEWATALQKSCGYLSASLIAP